MILLDTHVLLWMSLDPKKLSKRAREAILDAWTKDGVAVAAISLWELAWLAENGRVQVSGTVEAFVRACVSKVIIRPITPEIAVHAVQLPSHYPKDPQDRLIGATARVEGLPLVTADTDILASKAVTTIW
jgi:PIN domain nuclease of toxin-antitoxin system